jgi:hypothetical protein
MTWMIFHAELDESHSFHMNIFIEPFSQMKKTQLKIKTENCIEFLGAPFLISIFKWILLLEIQIRACHLLLKSILRQNKNYENSNISPCKNKISKKSSKRNQNPSRYYN